MLALESQFSLLHYLETGLSHFQFQLAYTTQHTVSKLSGLKQPFSILSLIGRLAGQLGNTHVITVKYWLGMEPSKALTGLDMQDVPFI